MSMTQFIYMKLTIVTTYITNLLFFLCRAEGGDLQTVLDTEEFLQEHVCTDILRDTLQGLKFLHTHSIAHLDIKVFTIYVVLRS